MPQELRVIRCYKCESFQVDIEKKSNKWKCKMCGERQSLRKVYSSGTGKDCRKLVQELNNLRFKRDLSLDKKLEQLVSTANDNSTYSEKEHQIDDSCASSKWSQFEDFGNQAQCENEENKVSPPRKRLKTSITQSSETLDLHFIDSVAVKKPLKRHLLYDNDDWSTSSVKYAKLNNTSRQTTSINMPMNKWLQYDSEAENNSNSNEHNPNNTFVRTSAISSGQPSTDEESCKTTSNRNSTWNFYTEWDSFSEPSQTSCNEVEINDIIDDQFEEFETRTVAKKESTTKHKTKPFDLFNSIDDDKELETIFNL